MTVIIILALALAALGLFAALTTLWHGKDDSPAIHEAPVDCGSCDGNNSRCIQDCLLEDSLKEVEYFDDEELDAFIGRPSDGYSDEEAALFEEVIYSMRPEETAAWSRSLQLRGINVPDQVKAELYLLLEDHR